MAVRVKLFTRYVRFPVTGVSTSVTGRQTLWGIRTEAHSCPLMYFVPTQCRTMDSNPRDSNQLITRSSFVRQACDGVQRTMRYAFKFAIVAAVVYHTP